MDRKPFKLEKYDIEENIVGKTQKTATKRKIKSEKDATKKPSKAPTKKRKTENEDDEFEVEKKKKPCVTSGKPAVSWKVEEVIASNVHIPAWAAKNTVKLLDDGCTIPFIARYRTDQTSGMEVKKLRETLSMLEELRYLSMWLYFLYLWND